MIVAAIITLLWPIFQLSYIKYSKVKLQLPKAERRNSDFFSIIVAIKEEAISTVKELVENLSSLDYDNYEVLIISDDDERYFKKLSESLSLPSNFKLIRRENNRGKKAGALNYGVSLARGDYLVFLDAEARVDKDFLKRLNGRIKEAAAFRLKVRNDNFPLGKIYSSGTEYSMDVLFKGRYIKGRIIIPNGSAFAIRKDVLIRVGGWKEGVITEDLELGIRLALSGVKVEYLDDVIVYTLSPFNSIDLYRQIERWAYGSAQLLRESLSLLKLGVNGFEAFLYSQQWGIYPFYLLILIIVASLQPLLKISIWYYISSFLILGIIGGFIYAKLGTHSDVRSEIATYLASLIGYFKGVTGIEYKWRITPKTPEESEKRQSVKEVSILMYILLILSYLDVMFRAYFSSIVLLGIALMCMYFNYVTIF